MTNIRTALAMAALSMGGAGVMSFGQSERYNVHEPRNDIKYTDSGKALSKRRKRRLRGKGQPC